MALVTPDDERAARTADPEALELAIKILRDLGTDIQPNLFLSDMRRKRLFSAADYLQNQFDDACRFLMEDAL